MKILVVGSGGREHALVWKIAQSQKVKKIYAAPGNAGIGELAECVDIKAEDIEGLTRFAKDNKIDLTVVGPEAPLVAGIVDIFQKEGLKIFGPTKETAQLEGSKVFAKEFMSRHKIPTAEFKIFNDSSQAKDYVRKKEAPMVVKANGLAQGKGVIICKTTEEALETIELIMEKRAFGKSGDRVIVEECLEGEEASILVITDGENLIPLESSQDHKRIYDGDRGANTGGMGAYSPAPVITQEILKEIENEIFKPTIRGMLQEGRKFKGVLYAGLMITEDGPKVLEFNVRYGDPEIQAILPRLKSDLVETMVLSIEERLNEIKLDWDRRPCVCVVIASGGYPGDYEKGMEILGLDEAKGRKDVIVFHAGTRRENSKIVTSGGRVLGVTALGEDIKEAIDRAYQAMKKIHFEKMHFRKDIGYRALERMGSHV